MAAKPRSRARVLLVLSALALLTAGAALWNHRPILARLVTWSALREARDFYQPGLLRLLNGTDDPAVAAYLRRYGPWFREGYLDRDFLAAKLPPGLGPEHWAAFLVAAAYYKAQEERFDAMSTEDCYQAAFEEYRAWLDPLLLRSGPKEMLIELLTADYDLGSSGFYASGLPKQALCSFLFVPAVKPVYQDLHMDPFISNHPIAGRATRFIDVEERHWQALAAHCGHPREKVRAGALLLLQHHPSPELFLARARAGLADGSEWVRLAAAGLLALREDPAGTAQLLDGLEHDRWEVRWWCGYCLFALGPEHAPAIERRARVEPDKWVRTELDEMVKRSRRP
jgi:hypothetical protein